MPGPGLMVQLSQGARGNHLGRIILAAHSQVAYGNVYMLYSDDGGLFWHMSYSALPGLDETAVVQLPNGSVMISSRHKKSMEMGRAFSISDDDGETWGPITFDSRLPVAVCQGSMASF